MKYKVLKTDPTGIKFQKVHKEMIEASRASRDFIKKIYGAKGYAPSKTGVAGGVSGIYFGKSYKSHYFLKVVSKEHDLYLPKLNTTKGRSIQKLIDNLPVVTGDRLNKCIDFNGFPYRTIGFCSTNKKYFLFYVGEDWGVQVPKDCVEITVSEYINLQNKK